MTPEIVECTVCGDDVGRGPGGLGLMSHANAHRREFIETFGRRPEDYDEVRDVLGSGYPPRDATDQLTLWESLTDDQQETLGRADP